jgi:adenylate cyclase class IV
MKSKFFHECEVKYRLDTPAKRKAMERLVRGHGFALENRQLQTDFLPDTADFLCRQHKILLRFRRIISPSASDILLTLKLKGDATTFQEHFELEYLFSKVDKGVLGDINKILKKATGKVLPASMHTHDAKHFQELAMQIKTIFPAHRILLDKKRTTYTKGDCHTLFDTLPEGIGDYLEVEAPSPKKLASLVSELNLDSESIESLDYGEILKRHKQGQPDQEARTGLFSEQERNLW